MELTNILGGLVEQSEGTGDGVQPEPASFQARFSFRFDLHLRYAQASLPAPEPVLSLEA